MRRRWKPLALLFCFWVGGCSQRAEVSPSDLDALRGRVVEMEETSGRNRVRMQDMEERIFLLQDRVEANRLALQRRDTEGYEGLQRRYANQLTSPSPYTAQPIAYPPPTTYAPPSHPDVDPLHAHLPVETLSPDQPSQSDPDDSAIPSDGVEEVVYTQADFNDYIDRIGWGDSGNSGSSNSGSRTNSGSSSSGSGSSRTRTNRPQSPVVTNGDRLLVTGENRVPDVSADTSPLAVYREGLNLFNAGEYASALGNMERFLASNPEADYMDNALFWIGECHYGLGDYSESIRFFQRVVSEYPDGNKVPDSLLKVALTYERLNDIANAREVLVVLVETYPTTEAARRATERLRELQ